MSDHDVATGGAEPPDSEVLLSGYFILDGANRELIWFGEVERFVSMEQVAMAHLAARANKSTVIEWYYEGTSPLVSECAPVKRQYDGPQGYVDDVTVAHTGCCDIRFVQRLAPKKPLLQKIFDVISADIIDSEQRERVRSLFHLGVPLSVDACAQLAVGFKAKFWDNGTILFDAAAPRYSYTELISNSDVYDLRPDNNTGIDNLPQFGL